jgi:hypothetical protein
MQNTFPSEIRIRTEVAIHDLLSMNLSIGVHAPHAYLMEIVHASLQGSDAASSSPVLMTFTYH